MTTNTQGNDKIAQDFIDMLDTYYSRDELWDDVLDAQIHRWYANAPKVWPKKPYFSPSAAGSDPRELYEKALGAKRDHFGRAPWQSRWTEFGTRVGDTIQRDMLMIDKHMPGAPFKLEFNLAGQPMFEEFAKTNTPITYRGHKFYLSGKPDGILRYKPGTADDLEIGLEIKSKMTTYRQTSYSSMTAPEPKHVDQTCCYSIMYGLSDYIILYVNASKKSWSMTAEEYAKYPDIRAFHVHFTRADKLAMCDFFADVLDAVDARKPPALDLDRWQFNNYKTACAKSLSDDELLDIEALVNRAQHSGMSVRKKQEYADAIEFIHSIRGGGAHAGD